MPEQLDRIEEMLVKLTKMVISLQIDIEYMLMNDPNVAKELNRSKHKDS